MQRYIDLWDVETFDVDLSTELGKHADLIQNYMNTSQVQWPKHEASDHTMGYPENPHASQFNWLNEKIMQMMEARIIRTWHYTRMSDLELGNLLRNGLHLSTLETIWARFSAQVEAGVISEDEAEQLFADSPFQGSQHSARSGKFWMVSHPITASDSGVRRLLKYWGGESAYFWQRNPSLRCRLGSIGKPRIIEIRMPLACTQHSFSAACAVVATFGRTLGCNPEKKSFDLYMLRALGPEYILRIHSEGEADFAALASGYPPTFVDAGIQRWEEELSR